MQKNYVAVDDSGDPGSKAASSQNFVMAAIVFNSPDQLHACSKFMDQTRADLGWSSQTEFKFRKTRKSIIKQVLTESLQYDYRIYTIEIDKAVLQSPANAATKNSLYQLATGHLLCSIPYAGKDAKIQIDGVINKKYQKQATSNLRQLLKRNARIGKTQIRFVDSVDENIVQLADLVAGAFNRSLQPNKTDSQDYYNTIKPKIAKTTHLNLNNQETNS